MLLILATLALLGGLWLTLYGFAGSMSDAPSDYAGSGHEFLLGLGLILFAVAIFGWQFFVFVLGKIGH